MESIKGRPSKFKRFFRTFVIVILLAGIFCVYWFFFNAYSDGDREGILVKISRKGNVFKTHEGELWLSCRQLVNPEKFYFSVDNDSVANVLKNMQDDCVQVTYVQYRAVLSWRGDTKYVVTGVSPLIRDKN